MPHSASLGRRLPCHKSNDRFFHMLLDVGRSLLFCGSANLPDHHNRLGLWIRIERCEYVDEVGPDDRIALPAALRPLRDRLGVLFNIRQRTVCSAFCVAPDMIGTAAHCLYKTKGEKPARLADFWFARNYDTMRDYARIAGFDTGGGAQNVIAGSFALSTTPPIDATKD